MIFFDTHKTFMLNHARVLIYSFILILKNNVRFFKVIIIIIKLNFMKVELPDENISL